MTTSRSRTGYGRRQKAVAAAIVVLAGVLGTMGQASAVPVTQAFNFTGGEQTFDVPAGVTSVTVTATGAAGGISSGAPGGPGRVVTATLPVTPGQRLFIEVGGAGAVPAGGFNGGGAGGFPGPAGATFGAGGGGASDVRTCSRTGLCPGSGSLDSRVVVASGGGGGATLHGGAGDADGGFSSFFPNGGGKAGTLVAGGAGGGPANQGASGLPGSYGQGGEGGTGVGAGTPGGGGGGGGYYGGGGGGSGGNSGGGGGGSSFVTGSATNVSYGIDGTLVPSVTIGYEDGTPLPTFSIGDVTLAEGDAGPTTFTFTITRSGTTAIASSVDWSTADGSAVASIDYTAVGPATVNFAVGETTKTVEVTVNGDTSIEANDGFTVKLSNPVMATISDGSGVGRISNDDAASFSVGDATVTEGNSGTSVATFTVTHAGDTSDGATVQWRTLDAHATANNDYVAVPLTTLSFGAGETTKPVTVIVNGDTTFEPTEDFYLRLSSPTGLHTLADATGLGTITNDDAALSISDATVTEGNAGTSLATFTVTRAGDASDTATVQWFTVAGTATAGDDFAAVTPTPLDFAAGESSKTVTVSVNGDTAVEANETFSVRLGSALNASIADGSGLGRITNDDNAAFSIGDATVTEGNAGPTPATFTVTRSGATGGTATVQWSTADGTASAASGDYVAAALTTLTFAPGETTKPVTVTVNGDTTKEANETFQVRLTSPTGAALADSSGLGRITNDD